MKPSLLGCVLASISIWSCGDDKGDGPGGSMKSYDFAASANALISSSSLNLTGQSKSNPSAGGSLKSLQAGPSNLCTADQPNLTCVAPSALTGKYYALGLLIQASGQGMQSYMMGEFSDIDENSETYDFDAANPVVSQGQLTCCGGTGDLTGENTYFSDVTYMFAYLDATFKIPYSATQRNQVSEVMKGDHSIRYILAEGGISGAKRGDLQYKDQDGTFKWMSADGALSTTRPTNPITMDDKVVNWTNPFEGPGFEIPTLSTLVESATGDGMVVTSEDELQESGKTYKFDFDATYAVAIMQGAQELTILQTPKDLMQAIHLQGLPSSEFTFGSAGVSKLSVE